MNIRPAQPGDLPALLEIFAHARAFMAQTGNPTQWPATYPGAELMQQQIARGVCYVLEGNARPEATFCYIPGPEPTYAEIYDGGWPMMLPMPPSTAWHRPGGCMGRRQSALPGARPAVCPCAPIPTRTTK